MDPAGRPLNWMLTIDAFDNGVLRGWLLDPGRPKTPLSMDISSTAGEKVTVLANTYRRDLLDANIGDGRHAFSIDLSAWDLVDHTITIRATGMPDAAPLQTISTGLAQSLTRMSWSSQFMTLLDELAHPFTVTNDAQ